MMEMKEGIFSKHLDLLLPFEWKIKSTYNFEIKSTNINYSECCIIKALGMTFTGQLKFVFKGIHRLLFFLTRLVGWAQKNSAFIALHYFIKKFSHAKNSCYYSSKQYLKMNISYITDKFFSFWLFAIKIPKALKLPVNTEFFLASSLGRAWLSQELSLITMRSIFCLFFLSYFHV